MKHKTLGAKRFLIVFLVCILSFGGVTTAYATSSLTSIAVDTIGAIAAAEISCHKDDIMQGIQNIFGGEDSGGDEVGSMTSDSVPIAVAKDSTEARKTAKAAYVQANDTTCTKTVEKAAAQVILKQLTAATVNWINHGFKGGSSFFPKDTKSFLKAIGDQATEKFIGRVGYDKKNFPFGRAVAQDFAKSLSSSFEQRAQYSMDRVMANYPVDNPPTVADFTNSFQEGGWAAFNEEFSLGNNPIGFTLAAQGEMTARTESSQYNPAQDIKDQLARSGGFLDTTVCVAPDTYDEGSSDKIASEARKKLKEGKWESEAEYQQIQQTITDNTCTKTARQTPGSVVASSLTTALNSPFAQLTNSQDLNASLTAIFDALANQLMQKGLSSLSNTGKKDDTVYENNGSFVNPAIDVADGLGGPNQNGSWLEGAGGFNMFKDIPTIILNEDFVPNPGDNSRQEGYQQVLQKQIEAASRLIPAIYELDFCVPGPHPGWRGESMSNLQRFVNDQANIPQNADSAIGGANVIINKILDPMNILNLTAATADKREESFFSGLLSGYLSYHVPGPKEDNYLMFIKPTHPVPSFVGTAKNSKTNGHNAAVNIIRTLYGRYADLLEHVYSPEENLEIAKKLSLDYAVDSTEFNSVKKYQSAIADNKLLITGSIATVSQLQSLQERIDLLPTLDGYVAHPVEPTPVVPAGTKNPPVPHDRAYWIYQDYLDIQGKDISQLKSDYERELRRIGGTFDIIAPKIHSTADLTKQESVLSAVLDKYADFKDAGGYIDQCIKETSDPTYKGPLYRVYFPQTIVKTMPKTASYDGQKEFTNFELTFKDVGISFLPYVHYAEGQREDQKPYFNAEFGQQTEENTIQNDDVVTIDDQPKQDALAGLEALVNIY